MKKVSIIYVFRNQIRTLNECLNSLVNQNYKNKEIILVDEGSNDGSEKIAQVFTKKFKFVKYYRIKHVKNCSYVRPRIEAIKYSKGEILFITDANAYYSEDYLTLCVEHLSKDVCGIIGKLRVWDPDDFMSKYRDVLYRLRYDNVETIKQEIKDNKIAVVVILKKIYDEVEGYKVKGSSNDDIDLTKRMTEKGYQIVYEPNAIWKHKWKDGFILSIKNNYKMGYLKGNDLRNFNIKMLYFLAFPLLIILSFINIFFIVLIFLHLLPSLFKSLLLFYKTSRKKYNYSAYSLCFLIFSYIYSLTLTFGFILRLIQGK